MAVIRLFTIVYYTIYVATHNETLEFVKDEEKIIPSAVLNDQWSAIKIR